MKTYRYIYSMIVFACFCLGVSLSWAEDVQRVFMSADGRSIEGKLKGYNSDEQTATITRNDGKIFRVYLKLFSELDQQYIREQSAVLDFMHSIRIMPMLKKFDATGRYDDTRYKTEHVKSLRYVVSMKNHSPTLFAGVEIEYCLFYRQGERREGTMEFLHGVQRGRWELRSMEPDSEHVLKTENVIIYDSDSTCTTLFGNRGRARGEVDGIWLRVTAILPTGDRVCRELKSTPLTGKYHNWATISNPVGLNNI